MDSVKCLWLMAWGVLGGEWLRGLGVGFTIPMGTGGVCLWFCCRDVGV